MKRKKEKLRHVERNIKMWDMYSYICRSDEKSLINLM
jgi:hypothetical protein